MTSVSPVRGNGVAPRVSGLEVVIVPGSGAVLRHRLVAALARQSRAAAGWRVLGQQPGSGPPWVMALEEGDAPAEQFLQQLEGALDRVADHCLLLRAGPRSGSMTLGPATASLGGSFHTASDGGTHQFPTVFRAIWRSRLDALVTKDVNDLGQLCRRLHDVAGKEGFSLRVLDVPLHLLRPLGELSATMGSITRAAERESLSDGPAREVRCEPVAVGVCINVDWRHQAFPRTGVPDAPWVACLGQESAAQVLATGVEAKAALRIGDGAGVIALVNSPERQPHWRMMAVQPGQHVDLLAVIAPREAILEAASQPGEHGLLALLAGASEYGPLGLVVHSIRGQVSGTDGRANPLGRFVTLPEAHSVHRQWAELAPAASAGGTRLGAWAPRDSQVIELVADPVARLVALATPTAPLDGARFPLRVALGSIDTCPYPGTVPLFRTTGGVLGFEYSEGPSGTGDLLGFLSEVALAEHESLYVRWVNGVDALRQRHGFQPWRPNVPDSLIGRFLYRARCEVAPLPRSFPTFLAVERIGRAREGGGSVTSTHPDLLGMAASAGWSCETGPAVVDQAGLNTVAVRGASSGRIIGWGRARPMLGDVAAPTALQDRTWWGPGSRPGWVLLYRWRSRGQIRCTTGALPLFRRGRSDPMARLVGVVGWALQAGSEGVDLVELFHPRRRAWLYSTDPSPDRQLGFEVVGPVATLLAIPNQETLALYRSYDRRTARYDLHLCAAEAAGVAQRLFGFVEAVVLPDPPTSSDPASMRVHQRPGDHPVFRVVGAQRVDAGVEADLRVAAARGLATEDVAGFVDGDTHGWPTPPGGGIRRTLREGRHLLELQLRRAAAGRLRS